MHIFVLETFLVHEVNQTHPGNWRTGEDSENEGANLNSTAHWEHQAKLTASHQFIWLQPTTSKNMTFVRPVNMVWLLVWLQPSSEHFLHVDLLSVRLHSKAGSMWFWLGRGIGRQRSKREESSLCKCSLKSTCWSTLSPLILTYRTINSVK